MDSSSIKSWMRAEAQRATRVPAEDNAIAVCAEIELINYSRNSIIYFPLFRVLRFVFSL